MFAVFSPTLMPYTLPWHVDKSFSLMVTTHNSTALKENGITEDILYLVPWESKNFVSGHQTQKGPVYPHNFSVSFFHLLACTNPSTLMDSKQWVRALPLFLLFEPCGFDDPYTTQ